VVVGLVWGAVRAGGGGDVVFVGVEWVESLPWLRVGMAENGSAMVVWAEQSSVANGAATKRTCSVDWERVGMQGTDRRAFAKIKGCGDGRK
jgi:hypothetical protein